MISKSFDDGSRELSLDRLAFLHIPKTAGTSLTHVLASHWSCVRIIPQHEIIDNLQENELDKINLVAGHFYAYQLKHPSLMRFTPITVLRDPIARLFSEYRFALTSVENGEPLTVEMKYALGVSFFEYAFSQLGAAGRHQQLDTLGAVPGQVTPGVSPLGMLFTSACAALNGMYVCLAGDLGAFVEKLFLQVGKPVPEIPLLNMQEKLLEDGLTQRQRETLREVLAADYALYNYGHDLMKRWLDAPPRMLKKSKEGTNMRQEGQPKEAETDWAQELVSQVSQAFERKDWSLVCELLSRQVASEIPDSDIEKFIHAAAELEQPQYLDQAIQHAIVADLSIESRLRIANTLLIAKLPQEAWDVFVSGYHFLDFRDNASEFLFISVTHFVLHLANASSTPDRLRAIAWHYGRRMGNIVQEPVKLAPFQFDDSGPISPLAGAETGIFFSDRVSKKSVDDFYVEAREYDGWRQHVGKPYVREFRNVFVNRLGQVWRLDGKILRDCDRQLPAASREAADFAKRIPVAGLAISRHAGNFYHWMADLLPSLGWRLQKDAEDIPLIIRDDAQPFMRESLHLLGIGAALLEEAQDALFVERLYEGEATGPKIQPEGAHKSLLERVRAEADRDIDPNDANHRFLYISRRDSNLRSMLNEEDLEAELAEMGFRVVTFSSLGLREQITAIRQAKFVVGAHGAGFTHILFSRPETQFFEITPCEPGRATQRYCMARLSRVMGNRHAIWLEPVGPTGTWTVSVEQVLKKIMEIAGSIKG